MSYLYVIRKALESRVFYVRELLISSIPVFFQMLLGLSLGIYLDKVNPVFGSMNALVAYYFFSNAINIFQRNSPIYLIENEVISGNINVHFAKPYNFINYVLIKSLGIKLWKLLLIGSISFIILSAFYGLSIEPAMLYRGIIALPLAVFFIYLNYSMFGYLAMIFERVRRISGIYGLFSFLIGGGLVSASYFPEFIKFLPQYFYFGAHLDFIVSGVFEKLHVFIIYIALFISINIWLHKAVIRRMETNG